MHADASVHMPGLQGHEAYRIPASFGHQEHACGPYLPTRARPGSEPSVIRRELLEFRGSECCMDPRPGAVSIKSKVQLRTEAAVLLPIAQVFHELGQLFIEPGSEHCVVVPRHTVCNVLTQACSLHSTGHPPSTWRVATQPGSRQLHMCLHIVVLWVA